MTIDALAFLPAAARCDGGLCLASLLKVPFAEFAALLLFCALAGPLFVRLRQPTLTAYIMVGVAVGPADFGLVQAHDQVDLLAQIGVAVLLLVVGLQLDLQHVRHMGPVALAARLGLQLGSVTRHVLGEAAQDVPVATQPIAAA